MEKQDKIFKRNMIYRLLANCIGMYYKGNVFYEREELVDCLEKVLERNERDRRWEYQLMKL